MSLVGKVQELFAELSAKRLSGPFASKLRHVPGRSFSDDEMPKVKAYTIRSGIKGPTAFLEYYLDLDNRSVLDGSGQSILPVSAAEQFAAKIDYNSAAVRHHRDFLMRDPRWREFYLVRRRELIYLEPTTGVGAGREVDETVPCMACGICLPIDIIEVDHQQPQSGGEYLAVCKVFRSIGLTQGPPRGVKGNMLWESYVDPPPLQMYPKNKPIKPGDKKSEIKDGTERGNRYTLNPAGSALFSLLLELDQETELINRCLNHYANLKPLCPICNKSKGNRTHGTVEDKEDLMLVDD